MTIVYCNFAILFVIFQHNFFFKSRHRVTATVWNCVWAMHLALAHKVMMSGQLNLACSMTSILLCLLQSPQPQQRNRQSIHSSLKISQVPSGPTLGIFWGQSIKAITTGEKDMLGYHLMDVDWERAVCLVFNSHLFNYQWGTLHSKFSYAMTIACHLLLQLWQLL